MIRTAFFLESDGSMSWLRAAADGGVTQGAGMPPTLDAATVAETLAVVPGDAVVVHWTQLPALAPAQAAAAARILAADVSAAPMEATHVALGEAGNDGWRMLALVDTTAMQDWLARLEAAGIDPDHMVPAPLLLPLADDGVTVREHDGLWQVRGERLAFAAEPDLARMLIGSETVHPIGTGTWEAGLGQLLSAPRLDLRQGAFAKARRWTVDTRRLRRMAVLVLALLAALLATRLAGIARYSFAADRTELQLADAARAALPRGTPITDPRAQVAARLASLGGDRGGFTALATPLLAAMRDRPETRLTTLQFAPETGLVATLTAPARDRDAIIAAIASAGFEATIGNERQDGGHSLVDLTVRTR